jgi:hypothetical protein
MARRAVNVADKDLKKSIFEVGSKTESPNSNTNLFKFWYPRSRAVTE